LYLCTACGIIGASPSALSDYSASKAAVIAFTESLRKELYTQNNHGVKTTIICPAQISTGMFSGIVVRFPWLTPWLKPDEVAKEVLTAVLENSTYFIISKWIFLGEQIIIPAHLHYLFPVGQSILPVWVTDWAMRFIGAETAYENLTHSCLTL
jgi:short-subunit dehydrogenase